MDNNVCFSKNVGASRRAFCWLAALHFVTCSVLHAQQTPAGVGKMLPPEGPLIQKRAPDFSSWIVIEGAAVSVKDRMQPVSGSPKKQNGQGTTQKVTFVKTGDILHTEVAQDDTHVWNIWIKGDLQLVVWPGGKNIGFANKPTSSSDFNPLYFDFAKSDFPGFEWISADNYTGTGNMGGKPCLTFKSTIKSSLDPAKSNGLSDEATAYVDVETRLPVALSNRFGVKVYQFLPPPAEKLEMPADVQAFIDREKQKRQMLARRPSVPY